MTQQKRFVYALESCLRAADKYISGKDEYLLQRILENAFGIIDKLTSEDFEESLELQKLFNTVIQHLEKSDLDGNHKNYIEKLLHSLNEAKKRKKISE